MGLHLVEGVTPPGNRAQRHPGHGLGEIAPPLVSRVAARVLCHQDDRQAEETGWEETIA